MEDVLRGIALVTVTIAAFMFPPAIIAQGRRPSAYFAVFGCEALLVGYVGAIANSFGERLVWYRTPIALLGSVLILMFVLLVQREGRHS